MADDVKLPGIGNVKKTYVIVGLVGVLAAVAVYIQRKRSAGSAPDTTGLAPDLSNTSANGPGTIDPATGFQYGSQEDSNALGSQANYSYPALSDFGTTLSGVGTTVGFSTNGQWAQAAEDYMANTIGLSPTDVAAALGKYITGQQVTASQQLIVQQAQSFEGNPPINGIDGYPPNVRVAPTATTPPATTPPPASGEPARYDSPHGLHVITKSNTSFELAWDDKVNTAGGSARVPDSFQVQVWNQRTGKSVWNHRVSAPIDNVFGLASRTTYVSKVWANGGTSSPPGAQVTVTTN